MYTYIYIQRYLYKEISNSRPPGYTRPDCQGFEIRFQEATQQSSSVLGFRGLKVPVFENHLGLLKAFKGQPSGEPMKSAPKSSMKLAAPHLVLGYIRSPEENGEGTGKVYGYWTLPCGSFGVGFTKGYLDPKL